jgi:hypothetical protein
MGKQEWCLGLKEFPWSSGVRLGLERNKKRGGCFIWDDGVYQTREGWHSELYHRSCRRRVGRFPFFFFLFALTPLVASIPWEFSWADLCCIVSATSTCKVLFCFPLPIGACVFLLVGTGLRDAVSGVYLYALNQIKSGLFLFSGGFYFA